MFFSEFRLHLALLVPALLLGSACVDEGAGPSGGSGTGSGPLPEVMSILVADSNRDGQVDLQGDSDLIDKATVTRDKGALFVPNLDDDSARCKDGASKTSMNCFDAADEVVNGPEDARDLAWVKSRPLMVSDGATATIRVSQGPAELIRIFEQESSGGDFRVVTGDTVFDSTKLRQGITLAIEGKDIVRDRSVWDGRIQLKIEILDGEKLRVDEVAMRMAPMLTHSHADEVARLVASPTTDAMTASFRRDLEQALAGANQPAPLYLDPAPVDLWAQDYFEAFYTVLPGPEGPSSMRVLLRSNQQRESSHLALYTLLGPDVAVTGVTQELDPPEPENFRGGTFDGLGNLETIPPIPGYPTGRQIVGGSMDKQMGPSEMMMALLEAQGAQDPIWIDSAWLAVGHIDEFISFVPSAESKLGFKVLVADPVGTLSLLQQAAMDGHGKVPMLSYTPSSPEEQEAFKLSQVDNPTIEEFLARSDTQSNQMYAEQHIAVSLGVLRTEIGLEDQDIVRIPSLYKEPSFPGGGDLGDLDGLGDLGGLGSAASSQRLAGFSRKQWELVRKRHLRRQEDGDEGFDLQLGAFFPAAANMVVLPNVRSILLAKQHGPMVNGVDILQAQLTKIIEGLGYTPHFIDDFLAYHLGEGDIHCGTNTLRSIRERWWLPDVRAARR